MKRRELLRSAAVWSFITTLPSLAGAASDASSSLMECMNDSDDKTAIRVKPLIAKDPIPVAFLISEGAVVIDFCGPWEVFQDAIVLGRAQAPFRLYTVAETTAPVRASGGMKIVPDYTFGNAPGPKVIVIPAQRGQSEAMLEWIRKSAKAADLTMSVCTGALVLANTGLLSGKAATIHHGSYKSFSAAYPTIQVKRGVRFVDNGNLATAGGLSSGIDLALHVVERYYGREAARKTAYEMEYQGQGWLYPASNQIYAKARISTQEHPLCPVCDMEVDRATAERSVYKARTYYFCSREHKVEFAKTPEKFVRAR